MMSGLTALPTVQKVSLGVWRVLGLNPGRFTLQGTNTYLVGTGKERILIDTGEADRTDYCVLLSETLERLGARISKVVITHWHHDHLGGLEGVIQHVCKEYHPEVFKLPLDMSKGLHYPLRQGARGGGGDGDGVSPSVADIKGVKYLSDGEVLVTDGATLKVLATPGHTQDHLSLWMEQERMLFTGDCVLGEGSAVFEHFGTYMASLHKLLELGPCTLYPGHGPVVEDGVAKIQGYISHRNMREQQVIDHLKVCPHPVTARQIVQVMYKDVDESLWLGAENNVLLHLEKLREDGLVHLVEGDDHFPSHQQQVWKWRNKL